MKIRIISIFLIIPLLLSSCWKEEADHVPVPPNRTILFYMAGDNSLGDETRKRLTPWRQPGTSAATATCSSIRTGVKNICRACWR